ncbi:MAG: nucleotidyl transferase AbiEii/AbiGii toxin family protein [Desulfarculaceae bacterium]|nr:nucleotidyl transferase AbiEii/AbiGii toxin family protein [Desulfarculaceae bacterium]MCF8072471.1 nucleotidyl transferase AbiEii/AbiGii toxin family protein [Desulfarculaceae bacterium]MCF8102932.1 nucleotidyl transferase AbiEii/AbiGii toxin family protein [Desulfarculaceae bacterium]MCF8117465.1 nucleotidyl transferase AbiEii/AbiGii toxin family protein [Desulfarculaceae bacterium]
MSGNLDNLSHVARRLGELRREVVFVGGSVLELLTTDPAAAPPRPTLDVDLVVWAGSWGELHRFQEKLRALGFREDSEDGVICRWRVEGLRVDVMPSGIKALGFTNPWYVAAIRSAQEYELEGMSLKLISPPCFLATKLEALAGRGKNDYTASHDLEDVVAVVDGREELAAEVEQAETEVRRFLAQRFRALLDDRRFVDALPGHLPPDPASQARLPLVLERLGRMAAPAA